LDDGQMRCEATTEFRARDGTLLDADRPLIRVGAVSRESATMGASPFPGAESGSEWISVNYDQVNNRFEHGPALRSLRRFSISNDELWGEVSVPSVVEFSGTHRHVRGWRLHQSALDACFYAAACMVWPTPTIPAGVAQLFVGRFPRPKEDCLVNVRLIDRNRESVRFDFRLLGSKGDVLFEALGYRAIRLDGSTEGMT
jgi:hypothetical protein